MKNLMVVLALAGTLFISEAVSQPTRGNNGTGTGTGTRGENAGRPQWTREEMRLIRQKQEELRRAVSAGRITREEAAAQLRQFMQRLLNARGGRG